ncbi:MAG: DNA alkylation repair protein [Gallionellaceae bacterium]
MPTKIQTHLRSIADPAVAKIAQGFFKTGPGQYGEGDIFLGIKVPTLRALIKSYRDTPLKTIAALIQSKFHEERLFALLLLIDFYQRGDEATQQQSYELYLANTAHINNWDLVDVSAPHIVGNFLADKPRDILYRLMKSNLLWERRISIIATFHFIRQNDFKDTLKIAEHLLGDQHDLMHKAVGWMLREVGKRDQATLEDFLRQHSQTMPRTMLRYSIERLPEELRLHYIKR